MNEGRGPTAMDQEGPDEGTVPVFGTWRRIYAAVILTALIAIGLTAVFSHWDY